MTIMKLISYSFKHKDPQCIFLAHNGYRVRIQFMTSVNHGTIYAKSLMEAMEAYLGKIQGMLEEFGNILEGTKAVYRERWERHLVDYRAMLDDPTLWPEDESDPWE